MHLPVPRPLWALILPLAFSALAEETAVEDEEFFQIAMEALRDDLPGAAAEKLKRVYRTRPDAFGEAGRVLLAERLLESLVRAGRPGEALTLSRAPELVARPATAYWSGVALAGQGKAAEAIELLRGAAADPANPHAGEAALTCSSVLVEAHQPADALAVLQSVPQGISTDLKERIILRRAEIHLALDQVRDARDLLTALDKPSHSAAFARALAFLRAKLLLAEGDAPAALRQLPALVQGTTRDDQDLHDAARVLLAQAEAATRKPDRAIATLVELINEKPRGPFLPDAFSQLEKLGFFAQKPAVMERWAKSESRSLRALTAFHQAVDLPGETAADPLRRFIRQFPDHFFIPAARLRLAEVLLESDPAEAQKLLETLAHEPLPPEVQRYVFALKGRALFRQEKFDEATAGFGQPVGASPTPDDIYNATVAAIYTQNRDLYLTRLQEVRLLEGGENLAIELELQRALHLASRVHPQAITALRDFARDHQDHPRARAAELGVAEMCLLEFPPRVNSARRQLAGIARSSLSPDLQEQADYIAMWIEAAAENWDAAIATGRHFLKDWPQSARRAEVYMKIGEIYFNQNDFPNAQTQFQNLFEEQPHGEYSEVARFFAGKAALASMNPRAATALWKDVIDGGGELAGEAQRQQAVTVLREGNPDLAIRILDTILDSADPLPEDLRIAALLNRGEAFLEKSKKHPLPETMLVAAVAAFDEVIDTRTAGRFWRNQASVFKGKCLEMLEDTDLALETYYDVVVRPPSEGLGLDEAPEYTWYYRAGFGAIALLQERRQWDAAANLATKLSRTRGTRAREAEELANRIRLRHFIWETEPE